jgi:hypothetical protein
MSLRSKQAQARKLVIAADGIGRLAEAELDSMIAAETQPRAEMYRTFARASRVSTFVQLGVQVLDADGNVYSVGEHNPHGKTNSSTVLGPLAGAQAHVTARKLGPVYGVSRPGPAAMAGGRAAGVAMVAFADGTTHSSVVHGKRNVFDAQLEARQFNELARAASAAPEAELSGDPMDQLRRLLELLDAGQLTEQEYEARRVAIIDAL